MKIIEDLNGKVPIQRITEFFKVSRSAVYKRRQKADGPSSCKKRRPTGGSQRALSFEERQEVYDTLCSNRFADKSVRQVFYDLVDEGRYLCSVRTMYRILKSQEACSERRRFKKASHFVRPELLAKGPNQVWSWDITRLKGPYPHKHFYLYVILDIFSRAVIGWAVSERECALTARILIEQTVLSQGVQHSNLTLHSDRGTQMTSKEVGHLLSDLGVLKSFSRPRVSNDNPFSESQFKTLKYSSGYPARFESLEDARTWCSSFVRWYNEEHKHSGIGYMTPYSVHHGVAELIRSERLSVLQKAAEYQPERFRRSPVHPDLPKEVWINPPVLNPNLDSSVETWDIDRGELMAS